MSKLELEIDLDDGLPPAKSEVVKKPAKVSERTPLRFTAPEQIEIVRTPVALTISYAPVQCLGCNRTHKDHRGIFVESRLSNGVTELKRVDMKGAAPFLSLPKKIDTAPLEYIPVCVDCWHESLNVAVLAAQGPVEFGEPDAPIAAAIVLAQIDEAEASESVVLVEELQLTLPQEDTP